MKFDFFKKKDKVSHDCACGCSHDARDSVRLTDAEIAEDVLNDLRDLQKDYECLCGEGCDCGEKLCSCRKSQECLCSFLQNK